MAAGGTVHQVLHGHRRRPLRRGYQVAVLEVDHEAFGEAVGYLVDDGGTALLYLSDTGPLPASTLAALTGRRVDLVLLEETVGFRSDKGDRHLNLSTFADAVERLRACGTITDDTRVVAVHLGHDNPPTADLAAILELSGAESLATESSGDRGPLGRTKPQPAGSGRRIQPLNQRHKCPETRATRAGSMTTDSETLPLYTRHLWQDGTKRRQLADQAHRAPAAQPAARMS